MDRMKIIKRRLSMSLRSARPVDETLSELAEQINLEEPPVARDNGEKHTHTHYGDMHHARTHVHTHTYRKAHAHT